MFAKVVHVQAKEMRGDNRLERLTSQDHKLVQREGEGRATIISRIC